MTTSLKELVFNRQVVEFAAVAKEYCAFIENCSKFNRSSFVRVASSLLPLLYYKATLLPKTEPVYEGGNQKYVSEEFYLELNVRIRVLMGSFDSFPEVFDKRISETDDQFSASLAEYLTDIYQDLKDFTMIYKEGQIEEMNDALWECSLNFQEYWGIRLANSIRAIHLLVYSDADLTSDDEITNPEVEPDTSNWFVTKRQNDLSSNE